jgi:hypothetical protein
MSAHFPLIKATPGSVTSYIAPATVSMPGMASMVHPHYEVALSFAGEDRVYVESVARYLRNREVRVFYDKYEQADLWGKNLYDHLTEVYRAQSRYVVIFISRFYAHKLWTTHERVSAQARAFEEKHEYILPARFDDTQIPGLLPTTGYIELSNILPEQLGRIIEKKIGRTNFWERQARSAAVYASIQLRPAHRGAIMWMHGVTAVFMNDGKKFRHKYVEAFRDSVESGLILAESETSGALAVLIDRGDTQYLFNLVWEVFEKSFANVTGFAIMSRFKRK